MRLRCLKWDGMTHLGSWNISYGQKKGWESNCRFDSQPLKVGNHLDFFMFRLHATSHWSSRWRLQLCFRLQLNQKSTHKVIKLQNRENPDFGNFRTPTWKSWDKMTYMDVDPVARHIEYYRGKVLASPKSGLWWVLWIRVCPWFIHALKLF